MASNTSSLVMDSLCDEPEDIVVAGFYCDFRGQQEQTTADIMGAILKQLVGRRGVLEHVRTAFQKAKMELGGRGLRLPDMVQMLKWTIATLPQVFICIDALDECLPKYLLELLGSLKDILREVPRTRIFVTGRPHIEAEIKRYFTAGVIVSISPTKHEIKRYLEKKLEMDTMCDAMSDALRADILRIIPERISGMCVRASTIPISCMILYHLTMVCRFLLVSLNIDAILGEVTISERRQKLNELAKGSHLVDAYATTLTRMKAQKGGRSRLGMEALMWVSNSERPLHTTELCHALGVKIGSPDQDAENVPTIRTLLACALGLITVEPSSSTVRLVHFSLQEYLSDNSALFKSPHSMIAEVCLTYLNFRCVRELSPTLSSAPLTAPLVEYASSCWGKHIRKEKTESVSPLALGLLVEFEQHISSQLLLVRYHEDRRWWEPGFDARGGPKGFTGLHGAAFFGIVEIIAALVVMKEWDLNATDTMGRTALVWAAERGHEDVVRILLQLKGVNPNAVDIGYGRTPLGWAAKNGYEGVVRSLLGREDINPNIADAGCGRTALWWATMGGHERVAKLLLGREDIDPNTADTRYGRTPLWWATTNGDEGVVKLLLGREGTNPNTADTLFGQAPLLWAAKNGCEGVVKLLLEREDINLNAAGTKYGLTPLVWAAKNGHEGVVKLLLEREDISPTTAGTELGRTLLLQAVKNGHEGVVKLLLGREDIDPNTVDTKYGQTPLGWAAVNGHEGVVKMLLEREDINPNTADTKYGQTPLWWAAVGGHERVVKMLLEREDINPNTADTKYGQTPLVWATMNEHEGVVKMLLERQDINPNTADTKYGQTPLVWAAESGNEGVVALLLEREDINPNTTDTKYGQTPLWWATINGHEGVVKLLLRREDINPNTAGTRFGQVPLLWAAQNGLEGVAKLLLEREDINPNIVDTKYGQTPLVWASVNGHEGVAKLLLDRDDVSPDVLGLWGRTALEFVAPGGHAGTEDLVPAPGPKPLPPDTLPSLKRAICSVLIIPFLAFLFYFLAINPSLSTVLSLPCHW